MAEDILQVASSVDMTKQTVETLQIIALAFFPVLVAIIGFLFRAYLNKMERNYHERFEAQNVVITSLQRELQREREKTIIDQAGIFDRLARIETKIEQILADRAR